mmetsp:Transcript_47004/g.93592  ORF Transcript_47004/g.93592 Transcript_47004/m.93592 type:complete len:89 (+) Transcript_47004:131-397(+)
MSWSIFTHAIQVLQSEEYKQQSGIVTGNPSLLKATRQMMEQISSLLLKLSSKEVGLEHMIFILPLAMPMVVLALILWRFREQLPKVGW